MILAHRDESGATHECAGAGLSADSLFNVLMKASKEDQMEKGKGLTDEAISGERGFATHELGFLSIRLGNAFLFLIAGHEVTSRLLGMHRLLT